MFKDLDDVLEEAFVNHDELAFKEYLTDIEARHFEAEEDKIKVMRMDLIKKYNKIVSDRMSHGTLIEEIQKEFSAHSKETRAKLDLMDNKTLQNILSIVLMAKKESQVTIIKA